MSIVLSLKVETFCGFKQNSYPVLKSKYDSNKVPSFFKVFFRLPYRPVWGTWGPEKITASVLELLFLLPTRFCFFACITTSLSEQNIFRNFVMRIAKPNHKLLKILDRIIVYSTCISMVLQYLYMEQEMSSIFKISTIYMIQNEQSLHTYTKLQW